MKKRTHISTITLVMLFTIQGCTMEGSAAATTSEVAVTDLAEALMNCRPTAEEIEANQADRARLPLHMRELTEVDYRIAKCEQWARLCQASPEAPECLKFITGMTTPGSAARH